MSPTIHVAIMGGSGYGAGELLRLLTQHPQARVVCVTSSSNSGCPVGEVHPHLRDFYDLTLSETVQFDQWLSADYAVLFSALPHGTSAAAIEGVLRDAGKHAGSARIRVIDLSGDLRLRDETVHRRYYAKTPRLPELRRVFSYGLPELFRTRIRAAEHVANPGCLATAALLAAAPLAGSEWIGDVAIDAVTGSSGSGRGLKEATHHPTRHADFRAYRPLAHQHEPEIRQALADLGHERAGISFVPHSADATRGIHATVHLTLAEQRETGALLRQYAWFYQDSPFVRVHAEPPRWQNVVGSNFCDVSVVSRGRNVVAMAVIDNLIKGMAGTAIQNMNLMCGLPETAGLWMPALRPV